MGYERGEDIEGIGEGEEFHQNVFNAKIILNNRNIVKDKNILNKNLRK